jgi:hypothetical protein
MQFIDGTTGRMVERANEGDGINLLGQTDQGFERRPPMSSVERASSSKTCCRGSCFSEILID